RAAESGTWSLSIGSGFAGIPDLRAERHRAASEHKSGYQCSFAGGSGIGADRGSSKRRPGGYPEFGGRRSDRKRTGLGTTSQRTERHRFDLNGGGRRRSERGVSIRQRSV